MFRQKTTIIVGAGASCELGLPSGDGLKDDILSLLRPTQENAYGFVDGAMIELMKRRVGPSLLDHQAKIAPVKAAAERIRRGLPLAPSIDNFLHAHQGDAELEGLAKTCIAIAIIRAESKCYLFEQVSPMIRQKHPEVQPKLTLENADLAQSWYPAFAQLLMAGVQRNNIASAFDNLRFVIFNYDRCLEQYIWMALQSYFDIDADEAANVLADVRFIHPYGSLGPLPWRSDSDSVALGKAQIIDIARMASRIRTFTESVRSDVGGNVKCAVEWADTLLILGFGYLSQNIDLLSRSSTTHGKRAFSTAYGVSIPDQSIVREAMMALGRVGPDCALIEQAACRDLFANYRLHLSLQ